MQKVIRGHLGRKKGKFKQKKGKISRVDAVKSVVELGGGTEEAVEKGGNKKKSKGRGKKKVGARSSEDRAATKLQAGARGRAARKKSRRQKN